MIISLFLLFLGFFLLVKGADFLVGGATSLAKRAGISTLVVGLTVVSLGTSAPELFINVLASLREANDLTFGNVLGSNISNILLILGIASLIHPPFLSHGTVWKEIPFSILASVALFILVNDEYFRGSESNSLDRADGLILFLFFIIFMYYVYSISKTSKKQEASSAAQCSYGRSLMMITVGSIGLAFGGKWVVDKAFYLGSLFGVSESLMGLTVVALGTSLPELATSISAARKKNSNIIVGNIVGSNIFNIFWILGLSASISPIPFSLSANFELFTVIASSVLLFIFMFTGEKQRIDRSESFIFLALYGIFLYYIMIRG